jgi:isoquinoline 1-oxidoreductase alpha subunit
MKREARVIGFTLNGEKHSVDADEVASLLWIIREKIGLTGTKFGCGVAQCGACTVHVDGAAVRSCVTTLGQVEGRSVTTIEGLSKDGPHALQKAWIAEQAPQCGYCQSGQIMSAAALLADRPKPSRQQIIEHMNGNICRCGTYHRIIAAIERVAKEG